MPRNLAHPVSAVVLSSTAALVATLACSSEDPTNPPAGSQTATTMTSSATSMGTATTMGPVTSTTTSTTGGAITNTAVTSTTGGATTGAGTTTMGSVTGAGGATATTDASTTTTGAAVTTGDASTTTTGSSTTGGTALTDEQCSGISNGADCTTEGTCAPRSCGLADTGSRTCTCGAGTDCTSGICWDCTSCAWTEPYPEVVVPPEAELPACDVSVAEQVECTTKGERCMQGEEVCACWLEEDAVLIWDCDKPPSFWP